MNESQITIELRRLERGSLKAFADVTFPSPVGEITVRGFRVIQKNDQAPWVALPSVSYVKDGQTVNKPVLELPRSLHKRVAEMILAEFARLENRASSAS
jgi:DNA-binding cell septation regulator SpoVG